MNQSKLEFNRGFTLTDAVRGEKNDAQLFICVNIHKNEVTHLERVGALYKLDSFPFFNAYIHLSVKSLSWKRHRIAILQRGKFIPIGFGRVPHILKLVS